MVTRNTKNIEIKAGIAITRIMVSPSVRTVVEFDSIRHIVMIEPHAEKIKISNANKAFLIRVHTAERAKSLKYMAFTSC